MAGFREFAAGEPLTATNVDDFLMKQSVMKFADGAARDLALGTAVVSPNALREGMIAYLDDTDDVLKYDGSAWVTVGAAAIGSNVVQTVLTSAFSTTSTSFTDVTGLTATITPSSATSKILVLANIHGTVLSSSIVGFNLRRDSTNIYQPTASGSRTLASLGFRADTSRSLAADMVFLDSPATTSAITYSVQMKTQTSTVILGGTGDNSDVAANIVFPQSLTAIEVAA
jgi:hypothetical protein